jgi:hypothetical protein
MVTSSKIKVPLKKKGIHINGLSYSYSIYPS